MTSYDRIFVLPLPTVLANKGTGIVTSVPSDSPDDWMGLTSLQKLEGERVKQNLEDDWVLPFQVLGHVSLPSLAGQDRGFK